MTAPCVERPRVDRAAGPSSVLIATRAKDEPEDPVDQRDDDRCDQTPPEILDAQSPVPEARDPGCQPQQECVDDEADEAQREDVEREGEDLDDRPDERVHE